MIKTLRTLFALAMISALALPGARADDTAYAKILKERDAVLAQILADREARAATGGVEESEVFSARLALASFRRDTAPAHADKIKHQELIVEIHGRRLAAVKARVRVGVERHEAVLVATDSWLEAQQLLEELRAGGKKILP